MRREGTTARNLGSRNVNVFEIVVILAVALVVIGPEKMPEVLRAAGKVMRELRSASNTVLRELTEALDEEPPKRELPDTTRPSGATPPDSHGAGQPPEKT
jgi:Tat protein translocase TatB subunit